MYSKVFSDYESDFYHYMITEGNIAKKTGHDYLTRIRFLAKNYKLDDSITIDDIEAIMESEKVKRLSRDKYSTAKAMSDLHAGLVKFHNFIKSDYYQTLTGIIDTQIANIQNDNSISKTERSALVQARVGQGMFRSLLRDYWGGCSISGCEMYSILVASHIKPWRDCDNVQRLDPFNGLLLIPNFDKLFDKGYVTFSDNGKIICSPFLSNSDMTILGINQNIHLSKIDSRHLDYLKYHRDNCYLG